MPDSLDRPSDAKRAPRVAFQGAPGAFSELAIRHHWAADATTLPSETFESALMHVVAREADFAVVPVENAIAGKVHVAIAALDAFASRVQNHGEIRVPIHLCLMAPMGATLAELRTVRSHAVALAQCRIFFARHGWLVPQPDPDTAGAARDVAQLGDRTVGAVAGEAAAKRYGLDIIARAIEDVPANWTRFVIVGSR
jgi:prephenate dehydratase